MMMKIPRTVIWIHMNCKGLSHGTCCCCGNITIIIWTYGMLIIDIQTVSCMIRVRIHGWRDDGSGHNFFTI